MLPWRIWLLWTLFLARGGFYCTMLPLWEGWDEYAHFAYLQHAVSGFALPTFQEKMSREIDESMRLAPLPDELRWLGPPYLTHPPWWALPKAERADRLTKLKAIPPAFAFEEAQHPFAFYEAQQPPFYYWLMAIFLRPIGGLSLLTRVFLMRLLSMALASLAIPFTFLAARIALGEWRAVLSAALLAAAPGFAIDTARIANDSLAIALASLLCWLVMRRSGNLAIGLVLGAGLLTKGYFPGLALAIALLGLGRAVLPAIVVAGWWYLRNILLGHSVSGWQDQASASAMARAVFTVNWLNAASVTAKSFFWFGAWSFLTLKAWIYYLMNLVGIVAAATGMKRALVVPWLFVGCVFAEMAVGVLNYQATHGIGSLPGWYAWLVGGMMAMILVAGLGRGAWLLTVALVAIEIYGATLMARHYHLGAIWLWIIPLAATGPAVTVGSFPWRRAGATS